MEIKRLVDAEAGAIVIHVSGDVDLATADDLRRSLREVLSIGGAVVIVDLSGVTFLDSSGIGVLLGAHRYAAEHRVPFRVAGAGHESAGVLRLTGADRVLLPYTDVDQALHASAG